MCSHRNWFTSYENVNGSSVFMGNNVSCQTVGMGNIRIKMYDNTIRTLTSVRHVPDLKKILFLWECWIRMVISLQVRMEC